MSQPKHLDHAAIPADRAAGLSHRALAEKYAVSTSTIAHHLHKLTDTAPSKTQPDAAACRTLEEAAHRGARQGPAGEKLGSLGIG